MISFANTETMIAMLWLLILAIGIVHLPESGAAFVVPRPSAATGRLLPVRQTFTLSATTTTTSSTTTTLTESAYDCLSEADPTVDAPLPAAYTTCPFTGILAGPQSFYRVASQALQAPALFSFVHKNQPMVEVSGGSAVRQVLSQEFKTLRSNAVAGISQIICGTESLRTAVDRTEHKALRQLVGVPLSAGAVAASIPRLEAIGRARIEEFVGETGKKKTTDITVVALDLTQAMTIDVTWQQILGLSLETPEEISNFHANTSTWLKGMYYREGSPEMNATLEARTYLVHMIEKKIDQLLEVGESDGSTVGGLLFATMEDVDTHDNDNNNQDRTLSRQEVVDNALLLMMAGTETTSVTLANALMLMGLHPDVWEKVVQEQQKVVTECGDGLTSDVLDGRQHCPYLEAVIQESMRILPVTLVSRRVTEETVVVDNTQIPKGWGVSYNIYLTHQQDCSLEEGHMDLRTGFRPERWLESSSAAPKPTKDYIPFGVGPRQCPGGLLSLTEMKAFLSLIARRVPQYELLDMDFDPNQPIDEQIQWNKLSSMLTPADKVRIRIDPSVLA